MSEKTVKELLREAERMTGSPDGSLILDLADRLKRVHGDLVTEEHLRDEDRREIRILIQERDNAIRDAVTGQEMHFHWQERAEKAESALARVHGYVSGACKRLGLHTEAEQS